MEINSTGVKYSPAVSPNFALQVRIDLLDLIRTANHLSSSARGHKFVCYI